jgi:hypothetical protein
LKANLERIFMRRSLPLFVILMALAVMSQSLSATPNSTVGLCAGPGTHYSTIQAAVNATAANATIDICPGTYPEQVMITKNLTLLGVKSGTMYAPTIVTPAGGLVANGSDIFSGSVAAQIFVQNADVTISHITVDGSNNQLSGCGIDPIGIYYQNSSGKITDDAVRNVLMTPALQGCQVGLAINVESNSGTPIVTISDNSVRNYDKNGITVSGPGTGGGPVATVTANTVIGLGATGVIAQNGIQVGYGASGAVTFNYVADNIYINSPDCDPCYGSSGILVYASNGITVTNNTVESAQLGIVPATDPTYGTANSTIIKSNHIGGTQLFDAIDLCSDSDTAQSNVIYGSGESGIHLDDECAPSTGSNETVSSNTINEACAGILLGSGSNSIGTNSFLNVTYTTLAGDSCSPLDDPSGNARARSGEKHPGLRVSPVKKK